MGNLNKAAQEIQSLTQRIDAALGSKKTEQIVWIFKVGDAVTTREFGSIQFMVVAQTGKDFTYPCPENNMRAVQ